MTATAIQPGKKPTKVLVLHNRGREAKALSALAEALTARDFAALVVDAEDDAHRITQAVVVEQPDLVFNLVTQFHEDPLLCPHVASLLELLDLPYTGSDPLCLSTCQDRVRTRLLLSDADVPVPPFAVVRDVNAIPDTSPLGAPLLVHHAFDDGFDEQEDRAPVASRSEVEERARTLATEIGMPLLIERSVEGRRIQAVVLGNRVLEVLPLTERVRDADGALEPAEVAQLDVASADEVRALARRAFRVLACRDAAQIDFALDAGGKVQVVDVRPVFEMGPDSPFAVGAEASELGYEGAVKRLADFALARVVPEEEEDDEQSAEAEAQAALEAGGEIGAALADEMALSARVAAAAEAAGRGGRQRRRGRGRRGRRGIRRERRGRSGRRERRGAGPPAPPPARPDPQARLGRQDPHPPHPRDLEPARRRRQPTRRRQEEEQEAGLTRAAPALVTSRLPTAPRSGDRTAA